MSGWVEIVVGAGLGVLLTFNCWRISILSKAVKLLLEIESKRHRK